MPIEISNLRTFCFHTNLYSNLPILDSHASSKERTELAFFTPNSELKDTWLLKSQPKITKEPNAISSPQVLSCLSCMLVIHLSKKLFQTILTTNSWRIRNMILSGKPTREEDPSITSLNNSRICLSEWLHTLHPTDQKLNKSLSILGLREQFALTAKSRMNSVWDRRNSTLCWIKEENNKRLKNSKTWLLPPLEHPSTEAMEMTLRTKL